MNQEKTEKEGFIQSLVRTVLKRDDWKTPKDIYEEAGISKQNYFNTMADDRDVLPEHWCRWRKAIKMSRPAFWAAAREWFDQE